MIRSLAPFLAFLVLMATACGGDPTPDAHTLPEPAVATVVDSIFPVEEELRRFRVGLTPTDTLQGGAADPAGLVNVFLRAIEAADTLTLAGLALNRSEFAWLYYPYTQYTEPPYQLSPALVWFQLQNRSSRGLSRLLQRYAGQPLFDTGFTCPDDGEAFGEGWIWHGCTVLGQIPSGEEVEERLFASILSLHGRAKFVSFSNEL
jgi:hypothetical protein